MLLFWIFSQLRRASAAGTFLGLLAVGSLSAAGAGYELDVSPRQLNPRPVPADIFGANIGYWSDVSARGYQSAAREAGITMFRFQPGNYQDPHTIPGAVGMWDFTAADTVGARRLGEFGRFLEATGTTGQISFNYGAGSPAQAAALVAYLRVRVDAPEAALNFPLGSSVVEPSNDGPRTRDWRTVGFWARLRAEAPRSVDDGFNKLRLHHPAPFPITDWECGNEADYAAVPCYRYQVPGESSLAEGAANPAGHRADAWDYANFYAAARALMHGVDPTIKVGASAGFFNLSAHDSAHEVPALFPKGEGKSATTRAWTPVMLTRLRELGVVPDFIIAHRYTTQPDFAWNNDYLLRGALRAYLGGEAAGNRPPIHITEMNATADESSPFVTSIGNAVNYARSNADALQCDVANLCWFTFLGGAHRTTTPFAADWRGYHNWGLVAEAPAAEQVDWPGLFVGAQFPAFHAAGLMRRFIRPGDRVYAAAALTPANDNAAPIHIYAARRAASALTILILNDQESPETLRLALKNSGPLPGRIAGLRYGRAQDDEQKRKAFARPPVRTNNAPEAFDVPLMEGVFSYDVPPRSVTVFTIPGRGFGL